MQIQKRRERLLNKTKKVLSNGAQITICSSEKAIHLFERVCFQCGVPFFTAPFAKDALHSREKKIGITKIVIEYQWLRFKESL